MKKLFILFLIIVFTALLVSCELDDDSVKLIEDIADITGDIINNLDNTNNSQSVSSIEVDNRDESENDISEISSDSNKSNSLTSEKDISTTQSKDKTESNTKVDGSKINSPASSDNSTYTDKVSKEGVYNTVDDVALYIHLYDKLPKNYITKNDARDLGWNGGNVEKYAPGKSIGGDKFGNFEEILPNKKGRTYKECDIDTFGKPSRGGKRIVYSNDGLIFYTDDHYESFVQLYDSNGKVS